MKVAGCIIRNKSILASTEADFIAQYKGCEITISTDHGFGPAKYGHLTRFNIEVTAEDGGYLVDTYEDLHSIRDAIIYALKGACLILGKKE